jgi:hypothetical protein
LVVEVDLTSHTHSRRQFQRTRPALHNVRHRNKHGQPRIARRAIISTVSFYSSLIGFFLGFAFGVGCALAVMYSIYMGGYRAAMKDAQLASPPERFLKAQAKAARSTSQN